MCRSCLKDYLIDKRSFKVGVHFVLSLGAQTKVQVQAGQGEPIVQVDGGYQARALSLVDAGAHIANEVKAVKEATLLFLASESTSGLGALLALFAKDDQLLEDDDASTGSLPGLVTSVSSDGVHNAGDIVFEPEEDSSSDEDLWEAFRARAQ